jgi:hypothetical protein
MKTIVPANPIKVFMRQGEIADGEYMASNVAFIIVDGPPDFPKLVFVTISGTPIPSSNIAFARVLIDGAWVSHD